MYNNRQYRVSFGPQVSSVVKNLIIANCIIFLLQKILEYSVGFGYLGYFSLVPYLVIKKVYIWQLFSYMFLHGGMWHLFFNMFGLWMFGSEVEYALGSKRFLNFYLFSGFFAALCTCALGFVRREIFVSPTVGASGAIFGVLMAFGLLFPDRIVLAFMIFPMKAKHFVIVFGLLELYFTFSSNNNIAYFAHVGGMVGGYLFLRYKEIFSHVIENFEKERKMKDLNEDLLLQEKVNKLLEKISRDGIHTLTDGEREFLHRASERLKKRKQW